MVGEGEASLSRASSRVSSRAASVLLTLIHGGRNSGGRWGERQAGRVWAAENARGSIQCL